MEGKRVEKKYYLDLAEIIYCSKTKKDVWQNSIDYLRSRNDFKSVVHANRLQDFGQMLYTENLKDIKKSFLDFEKRLASWAKEKNINATFVARQKDFVGLNEKIILFIRQGRLVSKVNDFLGARIIIDSDQSELENIKLCYEALKEVINFFVVDRHCIPLEAEPVLNTGIEQELASGIIIPEGDTIFIPEFEGIVKNYIRNPKKNGYQSLHIILKNDNMQVFEIQIRTKKMHELAEKGSADHGTYKDKRYGNSRIIIDPNKIHIPGFKVHSDGKIEDQIGLIKSINPFKLL